jgi:undecaprenyl-diphosphatase
MIGADGESTSSSGASGDGVERPPAQGELPEPERLPLSYMEAGAVVSLAMAVLSLFFFGWIAEGMLEGSTTRFDLAVREWVHQFAAPAMTRIMTVISLLGYNFLIVELVIALVVFCFLRWKRAAAWLAVTMAGALAMDLALKYAFRRPRPQVFFGAELHSYSFPSGHALCSFSFYGVLAGLIAARTKSPALRGVASAAAATLVAAIGLSRIYLGMHYPSDVIAGYLAAAVWVASLLTLDRWRKTHRRKREQLQSEL